MKNLSRVHFIIGFVLGAMIFGSASALAVSTIAYTTTSKVFVNGQNMEFEAYNIGGNNYFKLRDIGSAVGFSVVWDAAADAVLIETNVGQNVSSPAAISVPVSASAITIDERQAEIIRLTNEERRKAGVPELIVLPELMNSAQTKAQDFIDNSYFSHISPVYGTPKEQIKPFVPDAKSCAENISSWARTPQEAFAAWVNSPEHLRNMLDKKYTYIGVGVVKDANGNYWWVQQFVGY